MGSTQADPDDFERSMWLELHDTQLNSDGSQLVTRKMDDTAAAV